MAESRSTSKSIFPKPRASKQNEPHYGSKPKSIKDCVLKPEDLKPIRRPESSWSQRQKLQVLTFLYYHRIPINDTVRAPTQLEASEIYGVPQRTISGWVQQQNKIEGSSIIRSPRALVVCQWPELESRLYQLFLGRRERRQAVCAGWFRIHALEVFRELFPGVSYHTCYTVFRFSNGWFWGFIGRHRISLRFITEKAPEDYRKLMINWLRSNRRISQPLPVAPAPSNDLEILLIRAVGRYDLSNICNLDETPLPLGYLSGRTYSTIGSHPIWVKELRSGWNTSKRPASLVLCVFADGVNRIPPMIIFDEEGVVYTKESPKYHPGVVVEFSKTGSMNEALFIKYIELHLIPALDGRPSLLALDSGSSHNLKTQAVLDTLRHHNITSILIPAGCTSFIQPLDVLVNRPLKAQIRNLTDDTIYDRGGVEKWSIGERRVMTTWSVGDAWYQFCIEKCELVKGVFRKVGLALPVDGSADHELDIKGFSGIEIGDWKRGDLDALESDLRFANVNPTYDNCGLVEFVAHGE